MIYIYDFFVIITIININKHEIIDKELTISSNY